MRTKEQNKPLEEPQEPPIENISETLVPGLSQSEYQKIREEALEKAKNTKHSWVAKGRGILVCTSCEPTHRSYFDHAKFLIGIDENGIPQFKNSTPLDNPI